MPDTLLITGGAGFIGSHLSERLLRETRARLVIVDNFDPFYARALKEANLAGLRAESRVELVEADLRDPAVSPRLLARYRPAAVFHLAAKAGVRPSIADPVGYEAANVRATTALLAAATACGVRDFVFASSSSVYGNNPKVPFAETDNVDQPISPYAATKKAGELACYTFHHLYPLNVVCLRFFTVYGPRQRPDLAIRKFATAISRGEAITLFGDGSTSRDYTFIDDVIDGVLGAWRWLGAQSAPTYAIYNLGNSQPVSLARLVALLEEVLGKQARIERAPLQGGDVERTFADIRRAHAAFGYAPRTELREGLRVVAEWLRQGISA